jgi:transglutaminase-like putative cysteine protease
MPTHVALSHRTSYRYDRLVALSPHIIRLRPAPHCRTPILSYSLKVAPQRHFINWQQDPHGNYLARLVFPDQARQLVIDVDLTAELSVFNPFDFFLEPSAETFPFAYEPWLSQELAPYLERLPAGPRLRDRLDAIDRGQVRTIDFLSMSTAGWHRKSATSSGSSLASRRPKRRLRVEAARAATPGGCSCRSCAISVWRRASSPAT